MKPYKFPNPTTHEFDERSEFANSVCKLIHDSMKDDSELKELIERVKPFYDHFQNNIRNIYELIDTEIPLFALYELEMGNADEFDMNDVEYSNSILSSLSACNEYYITKDEK